MIYYRYKSALKWRSLSYFEEEVPWAEVQRIIRLFDRLEDGTGHKLNACQLIGYRMDSTTPLSDYDIISDFECIVIARLPLYESTKKSNKKNFDLKMTEDQKVQFFVDRMSSFEYDGKPRADYICSNCLMVGNHFRNQCVNTKVRNMPSGIPFDRFREAQNDEERQNGYIDLIGRRMVYR